MDNTELYNKALEAITELFSDADVTQAQCRNNLNSLIGEINMLLDTLESEEDNE